VANAIAQEEQMARSGRNLVMALLVAMLVVVPLAARDAAKGGKAITKVNVYSTVTLAGKRLKPGNIASRPTIQK
jgi:hypothetical protein